jgi:hypothetical protein
MNRVDRTIVKYYENAIKHFKTVASSVIEEMPTDWKFGFEYLADNKSIDIEYDTLPLGNMILTHIQVLNPNNPIQIKKVIRDTVILNKWADKLGVAKPPVVYEGLLDSGQKDALKSLLGMGISEFEIKYNNPENPSFTRTIYNIFNRSLSQPALNLDFEKDIAGLIINFADGKDLKSFKLEKFDKKPLENRKPSDMYQISILDMVEYFSNFEIAGVALLSEHADERYLELMSNMFNAYIDKNATKYIGAKFDSAEFAQASAFELNTKFITNENTLTLVQDKTLSELFKIALGSFRKKRNKPSDIINSDLMAELNSIIEKIKFRFKF